MTDKILRIGEGALDTSDARVKSLMNNLVNAQTPGFKKSDVLIKSFPVLLSEAEKRIGGMEPKVQGAFRSQAAGTLVQTGGSTDLAIGGDGYFVVETPWGEGYTRDGRFTLDAEGRLVTVAGNYPLLGQSGPIVIIPGARVEFSQTGDVRVDDQVVEKVRVVNFENPAKLEAVSGSLFRNLGEAELKEVQYPRIIQGYVEASNVNIIQEMMELIYLSRAYNINTKMISTRDGLLTRTLEMGKTQ